MSTMTVPDDRRSLSVAPERALSQRLDALERANEVRTKRAQLKRDLKSGRLRFGDVLAAPPPASEGAKVIDLLLCVPGIGRTRADRILGSCGIAHSRTIGGLSQRRRDLLRDFLAGR